MFGKLVVGVISVDRSVYEKVRSVIANRPTAGMQLNDLETPCLVVDLDALVAALQSGHIMAAGLDVFSTEPLPEDHPIRKMSNVMVSSHIASVSPKAIKNLRESVAGIALQAIVGGPLPNIVNGV